MHSATLKEQGFVNCGFKPITDELNEIIIHHLQFNVVDLISTRHMMDQEPPKTTPSKIHFANSNIFPNG